MSQDDNDNDLYGTFSLTSSSGDAPVNGWDYVLVFPAPTEAPTTTTPPTPADVARLSVLASLRTASISYSQLWLPSDALVLVRLALPEPIIFTKAAAFSLNLRLLPRYGAGYLAFDPDRPHLFENTLRPARALPYFSPAERVHLTLATLRARAPVGAALNLPTLKRHRLLLHAFAPHTVPERDALLRDPIYSAWWSPRILMPLDRLKDYFGSRVAIYFAWLAFYARMLLGIAVLSVPVYVLLRLARAAPDLAAWTRLLWGLALCFWATYWLEHWKRRNAVLNVKWGLNRFYEDNENDIRPDFQGRDTHGFYCRGGFVNLQDMHHTHATDDTSADAEDDSGLRSRLASHLLLTTEADDSDIEDADAIHIGGGHDPDFRLDAPRTGLMFDDLPVFPYSSKSKRKQRMYMTALITLFFALCVAALSFLILYFKTEIINTFGPSFGKFVPGIATALLISVSDPLWKAFSTKLNKWENHRTVQAYENSLILKRFAFQFVSNYISLFYISLVKPFTPGDPCMLGLSGSPDCMVELETQLTSLVITKATVQQIMEVGVPFVNFRLKRWFRKREERHLLEEIGDHERVRLLAAGATIGDTDRARSIEELQMEPYASTIQDYGEIVIQYGFLVMFGIAFPLAALINLVNNMIECRTDTYKLLSVQQRPDADDAADIGGWLQVLKFLSTASVMTTAALVTITTPALQRALPDVIGDVAEKYPAVSFLIFEHVLLWIRWTVNFLVADRPGSTYRMLARQEFLIAKCFNVGWKPYFEGNVDKSQPSDA